MAGVEIMKVGYVLLGGSTARQLPMLNPYTV